MPQEMDTSYMSRDDQAALMRQFQESLSPDELMEKLRVENEIWGPGTRGNVSRYFRFIDMANNWRNKYLKPAGLGLAGLAGSYGIYKLYKYLTDLRKKDKKERSENTTELQGQLQPA